MTKIKQPNNHKMTKSDKRLLFIGLGSLFVAGALLFIFRNKFKKMAKDLFTGQQWFDDTLKWYRDAHTKAVVEALHPNFITKVGEFFSRVEKELGLRMYATSGYRTFNQQLALYNQNHSNAKAGYSPHNYGFAVDVNVYDKNNLPILQKATAKQKWLDSNVVKIAKELGFSWGGDFVNYADPIHFYINPNGLTTTQLLALHNEGKVDANGYVVV